MSKELTPLKALKEISHRYSECDWEQEEIEWFDIIETALKEYELMKQTKIIVADKEISDEDLEKLKNQRVFAGSLEQCEIKPLFDEETQKKLKALEIIRTKKVNVNCIISGWSLGKYNSYKTHINLTQEEYDLLKEILL